MKTDIKLKVTTGVEVKLHPDKSYEEVEQLAYKLNMEAKRKRLEREKEKGV